MTADGKPGSQGELDVLVDQPVAVLGRWDGQLVALVRDASPDGWRKVQEILDHAGAGEGAHMTQLGWWADGVELWLIEP